MFFTRLMFFFVLICLTSSCFKLKKPDPVDDVFHQQVVEFNRIIDSKGWKSINCSILIYKPPSEYVQAKEIIKAFRYVNRIDKKSFDTAKKNFSNALSCFYGNVLFELQKFYRNKVPSSEYTIQEQINKLNLLIEIIKMFKPLLTCMISKLECFVGNLQKTILENLRQLLILTEKMIKVNGSYNSNTIIVEIYNHTKININYSDYNIKISKEGNILSKYFNALEKVHNEEDVLSKYLEKVKESVNLFCNNFDLPK